MSPCLPAPCNISPCSPKYVTLRSVIDFFGGKKCQAAALISPSKRQKRHRGPDRPKIRPSQQRSESRQFKLSQFQSPLASISKIQNQFLARSIFRDFQYSDESSNLDLGQKFGQFENFQQLCLWLSKYQCLSKSGEGFIFVCLRPANVAQSPRASALGRDNTAQNWILKFERHDFRIKTFYYNLNSLKPFF